MTIGLGDDANTVTTQPVIDVTNTEQIAIFLSGAALLLVLVLPHFSSGR